MASNGAEAVGCAAAAAVADEEESFVRSVFDERRSVEPVVRDVEAALTCDAAWILHCVVSC